MTNSDIIAAAQTILGAKQPADVGFVVRVPIPPDQIADVNFKHSPPVIRVCGDETIYPHIAPQIPAPGVSILALAPRSTPPTAPLSAPADQPNLTDLVAALRQRAPH